MKNIRTFRDMLFTAARLMRKLGWSVQLYNPLFDCCARPGFSIAAPCLGVPQRSFDAVIATTT